MPSTKKYRKRKQTRRLKKSKRVRRYKIGGAEEGDSLKQNLNNLNNLYNIMIDQEKNGDESGSAKKEFEDAATKVAETEVEQETNNFTFESEDSNHSKTKSSLDEAQRKYDNAKIYQEQLVQRLYDEPDGKLDGKPMWENKLINEKLKLVDDYVRKAQDNLHVVKESLKSPEEKELEKELEKAEKKLNIVEIELDYYMKKKKDLITVMDVYPNRIDMSKEFELKKTTGFETEAKVEVKEAKEKVKELKAKVEAVKAKVEAAKAKGGRKRKNTHRRRKH
jgi:hypothetical protein